MSIYSKFIGLNEFCFAITNTNQRVNITYHSIDSERISDTQ